MTESVWLEELAKLPPDEESVAGVTNGEMLALHARPADPPGAVFTAKVEYAPGLPLALYARADIAERTPAVVFVHGGGWHGGDPYFHIRHAHGLAAKGYVTAVVTYRLGLQAPWPAALDDVKAAVRWVHEHGQEIGADPDRIAVAGGSAGGHLSAMAALDPALPLKAAVLWYPATDLVEMHSVDQELQDAVDAYFGDDAGKAQASPVNHVHPGAPPILSITGDLDSLTTEKLVRRFHDELDKAGVPNELVVFEGRDHAFDLFPRDWQASFDLLADFLDRTL